jgi:hypothetical protein
LNYAEAPSVCSVPCVLGNEKNDIINCRYALVGDSHAEVFAQPLHAYLQENMPVESLANLAKPKCPFIINLSCTRTGLVYPERCPVYDQMAHTILKSPHIQTIIYAQFYSKHVRNTPYDNLEGGIDTTVKYPIYCNKFNETVRSDNGKEILFDGFVATIQQLLAMGKRVILIYPVPETGWHIPIKGHLKRFTNDITPITISYESFLSRAGDIIAAFDEMQHENLTKIQPHKLWCDSVIKGRCITHSNTEYFYYDNNRLSIQGALIIAKDIYKHL